MKKKPAPAPPKTARSDDLTKNEDVVKQLLDSFGDVDAGFNASSDRFNDNMDYWDLYNCKLGAKQFYNGNSQIFLPMVKNAVNARKTRFVNQLFPTTGRHVVAVSEDNTTPTAIVSLLEYYIRKAMLRTQIAPALLRSGDVEGQYTVYVNWMDVHRKVAWKVDAPVMVPEIGMSGDEGQPQPGDQPVPGTMSSVMGEEADEGLPDPDETVEDMEEEEITSAYPTVEIISDNDFLVLPMTAASIPEALECGGSVTILRRWRKGDIKRLQRQGFIDEAKGDKLIERMSTMQNDGRRDPGKQAVNAAGVQRDERGAFVIAYETWQNLELPGEDMPRLCFSYQAGTADTDILCARRNPFWSDRPPILSAPVEKIEGSFKGVSQVKAVATLQYQANDAINEGMDAAAYALLPIIMTDPEKNPRVGSMILSLAAVWETSPKDTQFAQFPPLWKDAFTIAVACKNEIFETLSVNPSMITQQASTKKLTQAEIASEQQVDLVNTADAVTVLEEEIFTPLLAIFYELDHQFRDQELTVRQFGNLGVEAKMQKIPLTQFDKRYHFLWYGTEASRTAQVLQQQIALLNVIRSIPPQQYQGYRINMVPVIQAAIEGTFGSNMAPKVFEDIRSQLSSDPEMENELMLQGISMPVHPMDNHQEHMALHSKALQESAGDPTGAIRVHLLQHQQALAEAAQAQIQAVTPQPQGGGPAGGPRPGAQPMAPRGGQNPAGAIHADRMQDPSRQPTPVAQGRY